MPSKETLFTSAYRAFVVDSARIWGLPARFQLTSKTSKCVLLLNSLNPTFLFLDPNFLYRKIGGEIMGLIDLKAWNEIDRRGPAIRIVDCEQNTLADWRFYCHLAQVVEHHYARLENLAIIDAIKRLRRTE